ncbi:MAG: hypothetical protein KF753_11960 [Caldilineaceae bacterium]|nr:hypothetical protein [Caldilineaceae bacterium]
MRSAAKRLGPFWPTLTIALLAGLLVAPLWGAPGLPNSADGALHMHRVAAVTRSWRAGLFWPRWFPELYGGLGAPTFHYYSPLFYLLSAGLHCLGLALDVAAKLVITAAFALSGLAVYGWLRRLLHPLAGLIGALLFLTQPHIFREFYFQGDYPQLLAILILPLSLWAFTALAQENRPGYWLLAPLCLALLVLAHNLTAMIGAAFLLVYWLLFWLHTGNGWGFVRGALAAVVAALLSALFWLPALGDVGLVQVQNLQQDFFHYSQYFLSWPELLAPIRAFDQRAANPPFPHAPGWPAWLAVGAGTIVGLVVSFRRMRARRRGKDGAGFWALTGASLFVGLLFLTVPSADPLWVWLPGLKLLQFPSRLLPLAGLAAALAGAAAVAGLPVGWRGGAGLLFVAVTVLATSPMLFPRHPFVPFSVLTPADTQAAEAENNLWGMTSGNEFLPRWADLATATRATPPHTSPVAIVWQTPHRAEIALPQGIANSQPARTRLILPLHYFPAWQVTAKNGPLPTEPTAQGLLAVDVGELDGPLRLQWVGTPWQRRGEMGSVLGLVIWLLLAVAGGRGRGAAADAGQLSSLPETTVPPGGWAVTVLLCLFWLARGGIATSGVGWFQPLSPPDQVREAVHSLAVLVGSAGSGQVRLLGWDPLYRGTPQPGDSVGVRLYWQPVAPLDQPLHSFLHLYSVDRKTSWAITQNQNPGHIPTTAWLPALYYVDDLRLAVPVDQPPGNFSLAVGLVTEAGARLPIENAADGLVAIGQVGIAPLPVGRGQPQPQFVAPATVGDGLALQGYDLLPAPGGPILRTYWTSTGWTTTGAAGTDYSFFIHLLDAAGNRLAQWDGAPLAGIAPIPTWQAGKRYIDRRTLTLPQDLLPGPYTIQIGLYDPASGARLAFAPAPGVEAAFTPDALVIPFVVPAP